MRSHPNFEICESIIKLPDGSFTTQDMERAHYTAIPWFEPRPLFNANPGRKKICPLCLAFQPISEFILDQPKLRTVILLSRITNEESAVPVADVSEICRMCEVGS